MPRRGFTPPSSGDRKTDIAIQRIVRHFNRMMTQAGVTTVVTRSGGIGTGASPTALSAITGATITIKLYNPADPTTPGATLGTTTTDSLGFWEFDCATYCFSNDIGEPQMITYERDGVIIGHKTMPDHFWENADQDGYLPIMVEGRELQV